MQNVNVAISPDPAAAARLRIGIVTETYPPEVNGVALTVERMAKSLAARGHQVDLVRPRQGSGDEPERLGRIGTTLVNGLPVPGYQGVRAGLPAGRRLGRLWAETRPDVLYVATEGPLGWSAVGRAKRLGIPVISGFHTNFHSYSSHYRLGFLHRPIYAYLRRLHNRGRCTLVPTDELRRKLTADAFDNVGVLERGVDSRLFSPARRNESLRRSWGLSPDDVAVIHVGRLAAEKNLRLAVQSFEAMRRLNPRLRLVLVGDGPLYDELYSPRGNLIFCGMQRGERLAEHYASADVFLFPSMTETYGNVTLEAMASGLAVVAFDYAGAKVLIEHGQNGLLADYGDSGAFVKAGLDLIRNRALIARLGCNARRRAEKLDWECVIDQFEGTLFTHASGR